jgi:DNA-binding transcriptional LysR family regulator
VINTGTRQLRAFLEIARLQSFTKAAERIHISQAGLSMMVQELEAQFGTRLFDRTTRSVGLTEAGRRLQPIATRVIDELDAVGAAIGDVHANAVSTLRIAATPLLSASLLPPVLQQFATTRPWVSVSVADVELGEVRRRVLEGEADLGLGFFFKSATGMSRTPLYRFRLMRVSPADDERIGLRPSVPWTSLTGLPLIGLPADNPIQSLIESHLATIGRANENRPALHFFGTIIAMVEAGLGHAVIPSFALAECLSRRVQVAMLTRPDVHIDLYLATRRGTTPKPAVEEFASELQRAIPALVATQTASKRRKG